MPAEHHGTEAVLPAPEWLISLIVGRGPQPDPPPPIHEEPKPNRGQASPGDDDKATREARERYVAAALRNQTRKVAEAKAGKRNSELYEAAMKLGHFVATEYLNRGTVENALSRASDECGLWGEGAAAVEATISSGLRIGMLTPADLSKVTGEYRTKANGHTRTEPPAFDEVTGEIFDSDILSSEALASMTRMQQNDIGNADRLIKRFGDQLCYIVNVGWHVWDGRRWSRDEGDIAARKFAQQTAKSIFEEAAHLPDPESVKSRSKWAIASGNSARLAGMLSQAAPHLAQGIDALDADPWLLNCMNGTIDLRTGAIRPHAPEDRITKLCPVEYDPAAAAPRWVQFLGEVFADDNDLIAFIMRALGYSLTGVTREQVLFMLHGSGSNGKSLLIDTVAALFSDYARQCPASTFTAKDWGASGIPNDVARLTGSRFVTVVETEQDKKLAEALVKQATGDTRMTARYMHQEFFEFTPRFKLWFATNHKPRIRGTDLGIWRRIQLIPFLVTFHESGKAPEGEPVKDDLLADTLKDELPGILTTIVRGCLEWQRIGLQPPVSVENATKTYRESQDRLSIFIEECCDVHPNYVSKSNLLYSVFRIWATDSGETLMGPNLFGEKMEEKGFLAGRATDGGRTRKGIDVKDNFKPKTADYLGV